MNKTQVWTQASKIFADISELSPKRALAHLYGIQSITAEVREAVITLINAGSQASQYFADEISPNYNVEINNYQNYKSGQILDEYKLLEELGHGGMSQVFKAERINANQQTLVAIKIFAPRDNSQELLNHFINEQKILSGLSHPHIVKMLHGGKTNDETAYLVMELIEEALPLDRYCHNDKSSISRIIELISQCADALAYSHANLIIHRDLKPDNILIDVNHQLKIVDFGIAKLINNDISGSKTTIMALTPSYAAPEQINSQQITVKTDIFSLAVVALDLLTKDNPLPKDRLIKSCSNDEAYLDKIFKVLIVNKDLKNILRKALDHEPNKRYSSMQSFADDLNNYLMNKPVNATSQSLIYRIQKFAKRRSALFATMVSFVAFLIIGSLLGFQQYKQIKVEAQKAQIVKQFMIDAFEITDPDNTKVVELSSKNLLTISSNKLKNNTNIDPEIKFDLLQTLGLSYGKLGLYDKAIELFKQSLTINPNNSKSISYLAQYLFNAEHVEELNTLLQSTKVNTIDSLIDRARLNRIKVSILLGKSEFEAAHTLLSQVSKLNVKQKNPEEYIMAQRLLAKIYLKESNFQDSIKLLINLLSNSSLNIKKTTRLGIRNDLAQLYMETGEIQLSIDQRIKIINIQKQILGNQHPELVHSISGLSVAYAHIGNMEKAYVFIDEALEISVNLNGENSLITANVLNDRALILRNDEKDNLAIQTMYQVISIYENQQSVNYQDTNILKMNLAQLLNEVNKNTEAYNLAKDVYEFQMKKLGNSHIDTIYSQQILARILTDLQRTEEAINLAKLAVQYSQKFIAQGLRSSEFVKSYFTLAKIYQKNGQYQLAIDNFLEIIDNNLVNQDSVNYAVLISSTAKLYDEINDFENAQKYYIESIKVQTKLFSSADVPTILDQIRYANLLKSNNQIKQSQALYTTIDSIIKEHKINDDRIIDLLAKSR
jgi:serine/threonine-protein kinase